MNASLAPSGLPLEVLDRVRHVDLVPGDLGLGQALGEDPAGGPDERLPLDVLAVAGLLTDEHHPGLRRAAPEHGPGGVAVKAAALARAARLPEGPQRATLGKERPGGGWLARAHGLSVTRRGRRRYALAPCAA